MIKKKSQARKSICSPPENSPACAVSLVYLFISESEAHNRAAKYQHNTAADFSSMYDHL